MSMSTISMSTCPMDMDIVDMDMVDMDMVDMDMLDMDKDWDQRDRVLTAYCHFCIACDYLVCRKSI